jgi:hypothetical protein
MHYEFYDHYEEDLQSLEDSDIFPQLDTLPSKEIVLTANEVEVEVITHNDEGYEAFTSYGT